MGGVNRSHDGFKWTLKAAENETIRSTRGPSHVTTPSPRRLLGTHLRICTRGWRFFVISAAACLVLVIASSPRGLPQPPTIQMQGAQRFAHTASRWQQGSPFIFSVFMRKETARPQLDEDVISGHMEKKAWSVCGSTITASLPFAM